MTLRWLQMMVTMILAVIFIDWVWGRSIIEFELCHLPTGESRGSISLDGAVHKGNAPIYADQVQFVRPLEGDKCTLLMLTNQQAYVVGGYRTVLCKLNGGQRCDYGGER